jgi:electron transfer flavoprotein alpha subunit
MAEILVFVEHKDGKLKKSAQELLSAAKKSGLAVSAAALGDGASSLAGAVGEYGATHLYAGEGNSLKFYNPEGYGAVLATLIKEKKFSIVLAAATSLGKDLFPRIAAATNSGLASDCTQLTLNGDAVAARRPLYAGKASAEVEFSNDTKMVLVRPNALPVSPAESGKSAQVTALSAPTKDLKTVVKEIVKGTVGKVDLTEANIIVSGGRGMKGPEHFKLLEDLAAVLGAAVGASRAVVDAGWVPHDMQVGQTGKTVSPSLYIACGISGAIQHLAGMSSSKVIVAINKDKEAPIFQKATYGIVGDVFEVIPLLTAEFKKILQH